ncbi:MAG: hypothetical protein OXJ52_08810, partial [Oligoflexia bacterium]|nr:hypothetical protein [Oligoflexia bacterium]
MRFLFLLLVFPALSFSFSETELDSLEDLGTKTFSKSPWRNNFGFSLIRNLNIEAQHKNYSERVKSGEEKESGSKFCDFNSDNSICNLSDLYYSLDFTVYYSLLKWAEEYSRFSFLKGAELFLSGSFTSNFKAGNCSNLETYDSFQGYLKCGIGDISAGWTLPVYQKGDFISYFNFSALLFPLSKKSQDLSLKTGLNGSISALYFLKKRDKWSWAISSQHSLSYTHFTAPWADESWGKFNNPFSTGQGLSLILKQRLNKYLPANTSFSVGYSFIINAYNTYWYATSAEKYMEERPTDLLPPEVREKLPVIKEVCDIKNRLGTVLACGNRYQELSLGASSSWKLDKRWYLRLSVSWRDLISAYSPFNENEKLY